MTFTSSHQGGKIRRSQRGSESVAPFQTILVASVLAGLLNGATTGLLLDQYREHNPWHAERTQGPRAKLAAQRVAMGAVIGTVFGAVVGGITWAISLL